MLFLVERSKRILEKEGWKLNYESKSAVQFRKEEEYGIRIVEIDAKKNGDAFFHSFQEDKDIYNEHGEKIFFNISWGINLKLSSHFIRYAKWVMKQNKKRS